ncbi:MAG: restriction endonuclease subunit S [Fulvivirga sp.]|mgnify:CR=1 FL=1
MTEVLEDIRTGYKESPLGLIPVDWEIKSIRNISEVSAGGTPSTKVPQYWNGEIPWMNSGEINLRRVRSVEGRITEEGLNNSSTRLFDQGTVFMALAGQGKTRGKVAMAEIDTCTNQSLAGIYNLKNVSNEFLFQNLESRYAEIRKMSTGDGGRGGLNLSIINSIKLALPPLPEQQKIAEILSTVDDKIEAIEERIKQTQELKKGLMQRLLTKGIGHTKFKDSALGQIPESWEIVKLRDIGQLIGGYAFKSKHFNDKKIGFQVIRMSNVQPYGLELNKSPVYLEKVSDSEKRFLLKKGDVIITLTGTIGKTDYGNVAYIETTNELLLNQRVAKFQCYKDIANSRFIFYLFNYPLFRNQFFEQGRGGTGNQANVGKGGFESIKIFLPSIKEQSEIANILNVVESKIEVLLEKKSTYQELKKGLMQQLLNGKKRVKL